MSKSLSLNVVVSQPIIFAKIFGLVSFVDGVLQCFLVEKNDFVEKVLCLLVHFISC